MLSLIHIAVFVLIPSVVSAQLTTPAATYAEADYNDYKKSPAANAMCDPFVEEGFNAFDKQDLNNAIEFLRKANTQGCDSPIVSFKLALAFEALGSYYSAVQYYEQAHAQFAKMNKDHRYAATYDENFGRTLLMMGQTDKAMPYLERAAKKTDSLWILKMLGQLAASKGDHLTATAYYERALRSKDPLLTRNDQIDLTLQLARLYLNQKEQSAARRYYEQVLTIDPNNQEARSYMEGIKKDESYERVFDILEKR